MINETVIRNMNGAEKGFDGDQSRRALLRTRDRYPPAPPIRKKRESVKTVRKNRMGRTYKNQEQQVANPKPTKKGMLP